MLALGSSRSLPLVSIIDEEYEKLADLICAAPEEAPGNALLWRELRRAAVIPAAEAPGDLVRMNAMVCFTLLETGERRTVRLIYPTEEGVDGGLSVITPIGAALIGLRPGQTFTWVEREGVERSLRVETVNQAGAAARPPIAVRESQIDALYELAVGAMLKRPRLAAMLLEELDRAEIQPDAEAADDLIGLGSEVEFVDHQSGKRLSVTLVSPPRADTRQGRVSVLTPVGAGLLGLTTGQTILWPDRLGNERLLEVTRVRRGAGDESARQAGR